jgi:hypothetical protein
MTKNTVIEELSSNTYSKVYTWGLWLFCPKSLETPTLKFTLEQAIKGQGGGGGVHI